MAFNPLLFVGATAGVGAIAGLAAASVSSGGSLPSLPSLPGAGSLGRLFSTRSQQNFKSAEWISQRENKVNTDNENRYERMLENRSRRFGVFGPLEEAIVYPFDLGKHFIAMTFVKYSRNTPGADAKRIPEGTIFLPIPSNLKDTTSLQYNHNPLGFVPGVAEEITSRYENQSMGEIVRGMMPRVGSDAYRYISSQYSGALVGGLSAGLAAVAGRVGGAAGGLGNIVSSIGGAAAAVAANEGFRRGLSATYGMTLNPFNAVTFENVNFKQHQFQWKLMPSSQAESNTIKKLKRILSMYALPAKNTLTFDYPYTAVLKLYPTNDYLYQFKRCFLQSFSFDYAPSQVPAFFRDGAPVEIGLSMNFLEMEIWTSDDFERPTERPSGRNTAEGGRGG